MACVAIVHTEQLLADGSMTLSCLNILNKAIELAKDQKVDLIIVTGGKTRKEFLDEANIGRNYLQDKVSVPILTEERSTTFAENVRFTREKYFRDFEKVYVIARTSAMRRLKFLYRYFWPEVVPCATFCGTPTLQSLPARIMECFLYVFARVDPEEKYILRYPKIILRNKRGNE